MTILLNKYYYLLIFIYMIPLLNFHVEITANKEKIFLNSKKKNYFKKQLLLGVLGLGLLTIGISHKVREKSIKYLPALNNVNNINCLIAGLVLSFLFGFILYRKVGNHYKDQCDKKLCTENKMERIGMCFFIEDDLNKDSFEKSYKSSLKIKSLERSEELNIYQKFFILLLIKLQIKIRIDIKAIVDEAFFLHYCQFLNLSNISINRLICFVLCSSL